MPRFLIERDIPGIGQFSLSEFQAVSKKSNDVLEALIDQPWRVPANADAINEKTNLALLDCIREAA